MWRHDTVQMSLGRPTSHDVFRDATDPCRHLLDPRSDASACLSAYALERSQAKTTIFTCSCTPEFQEAFGKALDVASTALSNGARRASYALLYCCTYQSGCRHLVESPISPGQGGRKASNNQCLDFSQQCRRGGLPLLPFYLPCA